jgi:hypothetical protein
MYGPFITYAENLWRWKDEIQMDFRNTRCEAMDWIHLAWDRFKRRATLSVSLRTLSHGS